MSAQQRILQIYIDKNIYIYIYIYPSARIQTLKNQGFGPKILMHLDI
jgi:hypothetical protein